MVIIQTLVLTHSDDDRVAQRETDVCVGVHLTELVDDLIESLHLLTGSHCLCHAVSFRFVDSVIIQTLERLSRVQARVRSLDQLVHDHSRVFVPHA